MKCGLLILLMLCGGISCSSVEGKLSVIPCNYVDPFIGTGLHGHTFPGAVVPFGAVQLSPDTRVGNWDACGGYHYSDTVIRGFSHLHLSGVGCLDFGDLLVHPTTRNLKSPDEQHYIYEFHPFSHDSEQACPGYYRVMLPRDSILVELSATARTGFHRYTFPKNASAKLIVDLAHSLEIETILDASFVRMSDHEIAGVRRSEGWAKDQHVYFYMNFSQPFDSLYFVDNGQFVPNNDSIRGEWLHAVLGFKDAGSRPVVVKTGISQVSIDNAIANYKAEAERLTFDQCVAKATDTWNGYLGRIVVEGGSERYRRIFYTALYHASIIPSVYSDSDGKYRGPDGQVHTQKSGKVYYGTFSLWDTFRSWNPLMTIINRELVNNMVYSFLEWYKQRGELPVWSLCSTETYTMIGNHALPVIADACLRGIYDGDIEEILRAAVTSALKARNVADYTGFGYVPAAKDVQSVSMTLEYAYDDWCIAQLARLAGNEEVYETFIKRSRSFLNLYNPDTHIFSPKKADGNWYEPFDPYAVSAHFTEATPMQYRFFIPHDTHRLIEMFGGTTQFSEVLDSLFCDNTPIKGNQSDITGLIGQYVHGNEPSHHMAFLYNYTGEPWKSQELVRNILETMYDDIPEGIIGNEDCGQMSAWYILASIGLYPVCPASGEYVFTSPLFERIVLLLENGSRLVIRANDPQKNRYIESVSFNGVRIDRNFIRYETFMKGGTLDFKLSSEPNKTRGTRREDAPYSYSLDHFADTQATTN